MDAIDLQHLLLLKINSWNNEHSQKLSKQSTWLIPWNEKQLTGAIFLDDFFFSLIRLQSKLVPVTQVCLLRLYCVGK